MDTQLGSDPIRERYSPLVVLAKNGGAAMSRAARWGLTLAVPLRLPVVWLALGSFAALLAACVLTVVLALAQPDAALPTVGEHVLSVPAARAESAE